MNKEIEDFLVREHIPFEQNVNMKDKTWIKTGGVCCFWIKPDTSTQLEVCAKYLQVNSVNFDVVGSTSNCFYRNDFSPFVIISTLSLKKILINESGVVCDTGTAIALVARHCIKNGIAGYEGFIGLPGTVGGAVVNNAGCFGSIIEELFVGADFIEDGKKVYLSKTDLEYSHRSSSLKRKKRRGVILKVYLSAESQDDPKALEAKSKEYQKIRKITQEYEYRTLGSTFADLQFKKIPLPKRFVVRMLLFMFYRLWGEGIKLQLIHTKLLLWGFNASPNIRRYVSKYWLGCYTWRDLGAEATFDEYADFVKSISEHSELEIEVRANHIQAIHE